MLCEVGQGPWSSPLVQEKDPPNSPASPEGDSLVRASEVLQPGLPLGAPGQPGEPWGGAGAGVWEGNMSSRHYRTGSGPSYLSNLTPGIESEVGRNIWRVFYFF